MYIDDAPENPNRFSVHRLIGGLSYNPLIECLVCCFVSATIGRFYRNGGPAGLIDRISDSNYLSKWRFAYLKVWVKRYVFSNKTTLLKANVPEDQRALLEWVKKKKRERWNELFKFPYYSPFGSDPWTYKGM